MSTERQTDPHEAPALVAPGTVIAALVAQLAEITSGMCDYADMAQTLIAELRHALDERDRVDSAQSAAAAGPLLLGDGVFEVAVLKAQAAGMSVQDYLRDAILGVDDGDGDGTASDGV